MVLDDDGSDALQYCEVLGDEDYVVLLERLPLENIVSHVLKACSNSGQSHCSGWRGTGAAVLGRDHLRGGGSWHRSLGPKSENALLDILSFFHFVLGVLGGALHRKTDRERTHFKHRLAGLAVQVGVVML